ncbi:MAG: hypothetical protein DI586_04745 [Micavibrio aeruginosavorus]|uniref:DUF4148 domain-containing protein n=1 Tax=Micavibrio aeruginosavorus TaxID=349221 RepID=A0A2W5HQV5_9BACT|nr:MAG: hypothetical protein DI586_04745 [Micavibrio aeruginosavorus]
MKYMIAALMLLTPPAFADTLELYPKSRSTYQDKFDATTERYEVDKRAYVDDLYENKAEGGKRASSRERMLPEGEVNAILDAQGNSSSDNIPAAPPQPAPAQ